MTSAWRIRSCSKEGLKNGRQLDTNFPFLGVMSQTMTTTTVNNPFYYTFVMFFFNIYFDLLENATSRTLAHTFTTLQKLQCVPSEYAFRLIRIVTSKLKVWEKLVA